MSDIADAASAKQSEIQAWFAQCQEKQKIKTPQEIFQEKHAAQRAVIDQELRSLIGLDPASDVTSTGDRLVQYAGQLKELEQQHASTKESKERAFAEEVEERHKKFFASFVDILGVELASRWMRELQGEPTPVEEDAPMFDDSDPRPEPSARDSQVQPPKSPTNTRAQARQDREEEQESHEAAGSNQDRSQLNGEAQRNKTTTALRQGPEERRPPDPSSPRPPQTDSPSTSKQQNGTPHQRQSGTGPAGSHRKRPASPSGSRDEPEKRARVDDPLTERSIDFDQVYQDGNAEIKYTIARYPRKDKDGNWYILECKEHGQHFTNDPILGAAKHLATAVHGNLPRKHELAVSILGTLVKNCTPAMVEMNNEVAQEAFDLGLGIPVSTKRPKRPRFDGGTAEPRAPVPGAPHTRSSQVVSGIMNPKAGEIYAAYWKSSRSFYPVLILPWGSFQDIGFKGTLLDTGLLVDMPSCYVVDGEAGEWAEGYEDGGALVSKRQFPVLYFDELKFPEESSVGWVPVADLKHFDSQDMSILQRESVGEFIKNQKSQNPDTIVRVGTVSQEEPADSDILERGEQLHMNTLTGSPPGNGNGTDEQEDSRQGLAHQDVFTTPPQETPQPEDRPDDGEQSQVPEANGDKATTNGDAGLTTNKEVNPSEPAANNGGTAQNHPIVVDDDDSSSDSEIEGLMNFQPLGNPADLIASGNDFLRPRSSDSLLDSLLQDKDGGDAALANGTSPTMPINQSVPNQPAPETSHSHLHEPRSEHQTGTAPPVTSFRPIASAPIVRPVRPATNASTQRTAPTMTSPPSATAPPPPPPAAKPRSLVPKPGISRAQSSPIPAILMPDNEYLQQLAAQAVVSTHSELFKTKEPLSRSQPRQTNSNFTTTPRSFETHPENARVDSVPHPARRSSGFFDAVLGPRAGFVEPNGRPPSPSGSPRF